MIIKIGNRWNNFYFCSFFLIILNLYTRKHSNPPPNYKTKDPVSLLKLFMLVKQNTLLVRTEPPWEKGSSE